MLNRCYNSNASSYYKYGKRGIKICQRYRDDFEPFYADLGDRPSYEHSIDRRDNEGMYSCGRCEQCRSEGWPFNVRWATRKQQSQNKRSNRFVIEGNVAISVTQYAKRRGVPYKTAHTLLYRDGRLISRKDLPEGIEIIS